MRVLFFALSLLVASTAQGAISPFSESVVIIGKIIESPLLREAVPQNEAVVVIEAKGSHREASALFYEVTTRLIGECHKVHHHYLVELSVQPNPGIGPRQIEVTEVKPVSEHHFH